MTLIRSNVVLNDTPTTTPSASFASGVATAGNVLLAWLGVDKSSGLPITAQDNLAEAWTVVHAVSATSVSGAMAWKIATGGEDTVTFTMPTAEDCTVAIVEDDSGQVDVTNTATSDETSVSSQVTGQVTPTADGIAYGAVTQDSAINWGVTTWDAPFAKFDEGDTTDTGTPSISLASAPTTNGVAIEGTCNSASGADQAKGWIAALSGTGGGAGGGSVDWPAVGGPDDTTANVKAKLTGATDAVLKVSVNSDLSSPVYTSSPVAPDAFGFVEFTATGLSPDTDYHYGIEVDAAPSQTSKRGTFHTLPTPGTQYSFTWAHSHCMSSPDNVLDHINDVAQPLFFMFIGDFDYDDNDGSNAQAIRDSYDGQIADARLQAVMKDRWWVSVWDDHDFGGNNSDGGLLNKTVRSQEWQRYFPHNPLVDPTTNGAIYRSFVVGRVRFIVLDERYYASSSGDTDNASKTMLGATQKQWLKDELVEAEPLKIVVSSRTYSGLVPTQDTWSQFQTERTEIADYIEANLAQVGGVLWIEGDSHTLACDDGGNTDYTTGGVSSQAQPLFCGGSLNQTASFKGGPYEIARLGATSQVDQGPDHYGLMTITDLGTSIDISWEGRESVDGTSYTVTVPTDGQPLTASFPVGGGPQFARPTGSVVTAAWTAVGAGSIPAALNDTTPNDATYARSENAPAASACAVPLSAVGDPGLDSGHVVRYRYDKELVGGAATVALTVQLRQGYTNEGALGTLIEEWTASDVSDTLATATQTVTNASAITDYTDLWLRFVATQP